MKELSTKTKPAYHGGFVNFGPMMAWSEPDEEDERDSSIIVVKEPMDCDPDDLKTMPCRPYTRP
jgi:hypothetical protein